MANVEFHTISASKYASTQNPEEGALYFIKDNGEIRKGSQHVTGSRVYTADDDGSADINNFTIKFNGTAITESGFSPDNKPKKGDMLLVKKVLSQKSEEYWTDTHIEDGQEVVVEIAEEDKQDPVPEGHTYTKNTRMVDDAIEYSAYIYASNAGAQNYSSDGWQACSGNVDASKVILTQNITMAGNYKEIGNFSKGSTSGMNATPLEGNKGTAGVSVYELIRQMMSKTNEPTWKSNPLKPSVSLDTPSAGDKEYGEQATVTFQATFNKVYAQYEGGSAQYANNSPTYKFDSDTTGSSTSSKQKFWTAGVETPPTTSVTVAYTASTNVPTNNLGVASTTINPQTIDSGTTNTATKTATINVYRNWFYKIDTGDGTATIDSAFIRSGVKGGNCETAMDVDHAVEFTVGVGAKRIIVAIPRKDTSQNPDPCTDNAKTLTDVYATHLGPTASILSEYVKQANPVQVADYRGGNNGMIDYDVWIYQPASIGATEVHKYIIG